MRTELQTSLPASFYCLAAMPLIPNDDQTDAAPIATLGGRPIKIEVPFINIEGGKGKPLGSKSHAKHTVVAVAKAYPVEALMSSIPSDAIESVGEAKSTSEIQLSMLSRGWTKFPNHGSGIIANCNFPFNFNSL
ncbi:hypothetical protein JYP52_18745 [Nitratireductor aquibiodomus]|uniref:hypothetical protein n=1 Tax=Nitratireductor aquibiodomus TaxID=204799 RepID=UPI0019D33FB4|nr:hypothetical protein [Nitratireductor aquibiodomus]MBN7763185.1 hypothetical protein [Nitratireductor aquibiodomus]